MRLQNATLLVSLLTLSTPIERVEHRKPFVERAKEAWHQAGEGRMPQIEEGFYVLEGGNVGPLHRHISSAQRFAEGEGGIVVCADCDTEWSENQTDDDGIGTDRRLGSNHGVASECGYRAADICEDGADGDASVSDGPTRIGQRGRGGSLRRVASDGQLLSLFGNRGGMTYRARVLLLRPQDAEDQCHRDSDRHFRESIKRNLPRWSLSWFQEDNRQGHAAESICGSV
jgi:hypothetical protein